MPDKPNPLRLVRLVTEEESNGWLERAQQRREAEAERARSSHYVGAQYDAARDIADIAKLVRKDIKVAVKAGELPAVKYRVRISRYSMGRSLNVTVKGLPVEQVANMERFRAEARNPDLRHLGVPVGKLKTEEAYALEAKVEALVNAYNFDKSDLLNDYHSSAFAAFVEVACSYEEARERAEALVAAEREPEPPAPKPARSSRNNDWRVW